VPIAPDLGLAITQSCSSGLVPFGCSTLLMEEGCGVHPSGGAGITTVGRFGGTSVGLFAADENLPWIPATGSG